MIKQLWREWSARNKKKIIAFCVIGWGICMAWFGYLIGKGPGDKK